MTTTRRSDAPACSIIIATYNRADSLRRTLDCVMNLRNAPPYEVIVVDNASTDNTAAVVQDLMGTFANLHYALETIRGPAAARNLGVSLSHSELIVFTDDDVRPAPEWLSEMVDAADAHPEISCFGGRILPLWPDTPPAWLTRAHWVGALALQDYGDEPIVIDRHRALSLASANMMWRRHAFLALGGFQIDCLVTEDTEILMRLWRGGGKSLYAPQAIVHADVQPERIRKKYHRQWHWRNGRWAARLGLEESFDGRGGLRDRPAEAASLFGVPSFMFRQWFGIAPRWAAAALRGRSSEAFALEKQLWQVTSYIRTCAAERPWHTRHAASEITHFIGTMWRRKRLGFAPPRHD